MWVPRFVCARATVAGRAREGERDERTNARALEPRARVGTARRADWDDVGGRVVQEVGVVGANADDRASPRVESARNTTRFGASP